MDYRHEIKYIINYADFLDLKLRLGTILKPDEYSNGEYYIVSNLYFDTVDDNALWEKIDGLESRDKYRIRYYGDDISHLFLEKKARRGAVGYKERSFVSEDDVNQIIKNRLQLSSKLGVDMPNGLVPKVVVQYKRCAYVYKIGNVRVTLDFDIKSTPHVKHFLDLKDVAMVKDERMILEVKYDDILPPIVKDLIQLPDNYVSENSKYLRARLYDGWERKTWT